MAVLQRFYCISVASAALRSEATVRSVVSLFIVSPNICVFFVFAPCFVMQYLVRFFLLTL